MNPADAIAQRHQHRGDAYLANGNTACAAGSFCKAQRARDRARAFRAALGDTHGPLRPLEQLMGHHAFDAGERMAAALVAVL